MVPNSTDVSTKIPQNLIVLAIFLGIVSWGKYCDNCKNAHQYRNTIILLHSKTAVLNIHTCIRSMSNTHAVICCSTVGSAVS